MRATASNTHVLITGGAGFVGSHLADQLIAAGHRVRVLDNLKAYSTSHRPPHRPPQRPPQRPTWLHDDVELIVDDVRDRDAVDAALDGVDCVCHLAAAYGSSQSIRDVTNCSSVNCLGTAVLLQALMARPVQRLVVASSMSIYGEGLHCTADGRHGRAVVPRSMQQLLRRDWAVRDDRGQALYAEPTPEDAEPSPCSAYAATKYNQERMCIAAAAVSGIPTVILRLFNVYGAHQARAIRSSGVLMSFLERLRDGRRPLVYEDGCQQRDFVSVHDAARAFVLAISTPMAGQRIMNIGSGESHRIGHVAQLAARAAERAHIQPRITQTSRCGDVRSCFADISRARSVLGYQPRVPLETGLIELARSLQASQQAVHNFGESTSRCA